MAGRIEIHRKANDCGKNGLTSITITDVNGKTIQGTVANNAAQVFEVEDGDYCVFVDHGVKSPIQCVTVCSNTVILDACVIPKPGKINIDKVDLQVRANQDPDPIQGKSMNAGKDFNLEGDDLILRSDPSANRIGGPYSIVYKNVEERAVIVAMEFDGRPRLGFHFFQDEIEWPSSGQIPLWCVISQDDSSKLLQYFEFEPGISESLYGFLNGKFNGKDLNRRLYLLLKIKDTQKIQHLLDRLRGDITEDTPKQADIADECIEDIERNAKKRNGL
jgi:hypothetical protein